MNWRKVKNAPKNVSKPQKEQIIYAGFWQRFLATVVDIFMLGLPIAIITSMVIGYDATHEASFLNVLEGNEPQTPPDPTPMIINMLLFFVIYIGMWHKLDGQTPGKKFTNLYIVDAKTLQKATLFQLIIRYLGYTLSLLSIIGFLLPAVLPHKQALHDLISRTAVIYKPS